LSICWCSKKHTTFRKLFPSSGKMMGAPTLSESLVLQSTIYHYQNPFEFKNIMLTESQSSSENKILRMILRVVHLLPVLSNLSCKRSLPVSLRHKINSLRVTTIVIKNLYLPESFRIWQSLSWSRNVSYETSRRFIHMFARARHLNLSCEDSVSSRLLRKFRIC
jgi:hypothetical protein